MHVRLAQLGGIVVSENVGVISKLMKIEKHPGEIEKKLDELTPGEICGVKYRWRAG